MYSLQKHMAEEVSAGITFVRSDARGDGIDDPATCFTSRRSKANGDCSDDEPFYDSA